MTTSTIFVKVTKAPGGVQEVSLTETKTVKAALEAAGFSSDGFQIKVNGSDATESAILSDGDRIVLAQAVKSASDDVIFVKVTKAPGGVTEVSLNEGSTVGEALEEAGISSEGYQIKVNGSEADLETELEDGDRVVVAQAVKSAN